MNHPPEWIKWLWLLTILTLILVIIPWAFSTALEAHGCR